MIGPILTGVDNHQVLNNAQITDHHLSRWRFTFITEEIKEELLARLEAKELEADRKAVAVQDKENKKLERERAKKVKVDFDSTLEGQRILKEFEEKKIESRTKREFVLNFKKTFPGLKMPSAGKPQPPPTICSYCGIQYTSIFTKNKMWVNCSVLSCKSNGCNVICCHQKENCIEGYKQHIAIASHNPTDDGSVNGSENGDEL